MRPLPLLLALLVVLLSLSEGRNLGKGISANVRVSLGGRSKSCKVGADCPDRTYCCDHIDKKCFKVQEKPPEGSCMTKNDCPKGYDCDKYETKKCVRKGFLDRWC